ncbi:MAG: hypothetical protein EXQ81_03870 [Thermoleophilia bacterium]|nr:hypothetical protein [Thermoleophilia bacterium]
MTSGVEWVDGLSKTTSTYIDPSADERRPAPKAVATSGVIDFSEIYAAVGQQRVQGRFLHGIFRAQWPGRASRCRSAGRSG